MELKIPYGKGSLALHLDDSMDVEVLTTRIPQAVGQSGRAIVEAAMKAPIGSPPLEQLAKGKKNAVVICSDHTRPVPSKAIIPPMLAALRSGNPDIDITLLIATGCHRVPTTAELVEKFGEQIVKEERIVSHCSVSSEMRQLGVLPSGANLIINRLAAEAELLVAEGFIEPHFFAGYSGGRKSVLPGVCARETVLGNHCADFVGHPCARTGILKGNPMHKDMLAGAKMAGLAFIVNTVSGAAGEVAAAFAGHYEQAHSAGCEYLSSLCRVEASRPGDVVVTSNNGVPLDQNIYQAVKGMTAAEAVAAPDGVIVMVAACEDGAGGDDFLAMLRDCETPAALLEAISRVPMEETRPDQWEAQILARIMAKHRVILVCEPKARPLAEAMKLETAGSLEEAVRLALREKGSGAKITVIPDGVGVVAGRRAEA